jgi:hypothetical protein
MAALRETDLYPPVKTWLESLGYQVKAEIGAADIMALRGDDMVIVELKRAFSLALLLQGVERQRLTDLVYVALPEPARGTGGKAFSALCCFRGCLLGFEARVVFIKTVKVTGCETLRRPGWKHLTPWSLSRLLGALGTQLVVCTTTATITLGGSNEKRCNAKDLRRRTSKAGTP